jgi:hypothetical protein
MAIATLRSTLAGFGLHPAGPAPCCAGTAGRCCPPGSCATSRSSSEPCRLRGSQGSRMAWIPSSCRSANWRYSYLWVN